jgi:hypothetical protein
MSIGAIAMSLSIIIVAANAATALPGTTGAPIRRLKRFSQSQHYGGNGDFVRASL